MADRPIPPVPSNFHVLPFYNSKEFRFFAKTVKGCPWTPLPMLQLLSTRDGSNGEQDYVCHVVNEFPYSQLGIVEELTKQQIERIHIDRFATDYCLGTQSPPFSHLEAGNDPPDFIATTGDGPRGIECTRFTNRFRQSAQALFEKVRKTVKRLDPSDFGHLRGLMVFIGFAGELKAGLPPKQYDDSSRKLVIQALKDFEFDYSRSLVSAPGGMPQIAPMVNFEKHGGFFVHATPICEAVPASLFFMRQGFELGLAFSSEHIAKDLEADFLRMISKHDQEGVDDLIISVGAPDTQGLVWPTDTSLFFFMTQFSCPNVERPRHLKRVLAHIWETGAIIEFFPERKEIQSNLYLGLNPSHYPIAPPTFPKPLNANQSSTSSTSS
jgi:hypothetical protein